MSFRALHNKVVTNAAANKDAGNDGVNKIYFLQVEEKPYVKVGDTHRSVEERNQETMTNAALHRKAGTAPEYFVAVKHDGTTFRDKEFHAYLRKAGYVFELNDQGNESEWVMADANGNIPTAYELQLELQNFTAKKLTKTVSLRASQIDVINQLQEALDKGFKYVNMGACVRIGKTVISLTHAVNNDCMPAYIGKNLTSQSSAKNDNNDFGIVPELITQSLHGVDELDDNNVSKKVLKIIANIEAANVNNRNIIIYIDEVDDASHTRKSRDVITPVVKHFERIGKLMQVVTMSGTRIHRGEKILNDLMAA